MLRRSRLLEHGGMAMTRTSHHSDDPWPTRRQESLTGTATFLTADVARPVWQLCHSSVSPTFPPPGSVDALPSKLPVHLTTFVGRDVEVRKLALALRESRLVTVTGAGGCG